MEIDLPKFSLGWSIASLLITLLWGLLAFHIGQKRGKSVQFYLLLFIPVVAGVIAALIQGLADYGTAIMLFALAIVVAERIAWAVTLKEAAGEDKLVWFFLIWLLPLFGWLLYRATSLR